jgi:hypothetical protein
MCWENEGENRIKNSIKTKSDFIVGFNLLLIYVLYIADNQLYLFNIRSLQTINNSLCNIQIIRISVDFQAV